jgi:hypothetical protein
MYRPTQSSRCGSKKANITGRCKTQQRGKIIANGEGLRALFRRITD